MPIGVPKSPRTNNGRLFLLGSCVMCVVVLVVLTVVVVLLLSDKRVIRHCGRSFWPVEK